MGSVRSQTSINSTVMHSVRRVKTTAEQRAARQQREAGEIKNHQALLSTVLKRDFSDPQALNRTTDSLSYYPDQYTVWNIRREILGTSRSTDSYHEVLAKELKFTQSSSPAHPKVYWIWNHRRWVLDQLPPAQAFQGEMMSTTKLSERDPRNFHGWNYRWYVLNRLVKESDDKATVDLYKSEFAFTTKKINENFSNYSAWHFRAQLIPRLPPNEKPSLITELDYVFTAVSMDPNDQSGWLYYQWLLDSPAFKDDLDPSVLAQQLEQVTELYDEEPCIWAARTIFLLNRWSQRPQPEGSCEKMAELDPLRRNRYLSEMLVE